MSATLGEATYQWAVDAEVFSTLGHQLHATQRNYTIERKLKRINRNALHAKACTWSSFCLSSKEVVWPSQDSKDRDSPPSLNPTLTVIAGSFLVRKTNVAEGYSVVIFWQQIEYMILWSNRTFWGRHRLPGYSWLTCFWRTIYSNMHR